MDCPVCRGRGKVHRHSHYERYRSPEGAERQRVQRYLCVRCRRTLSVLEDLLPYRALSVPMVEKFLNAKAQSGRDPPAVPVKTQGALNRAAGVLNQRAGVLRAAAGLVIKQDRQTLWQGLIGAFDNLEAILLFLGRKINGSLLGDYQCLRGWWTFHRGLV